MPTPTVIIILTLDPFKNKSRRSDRALSSPKSKPVRFHLHFKPGITRLTRLWTEPCLATAGPTRLNLSPADFILSLVLPCLPGPGQSPALEGAPAPPSSRRRQQWRWWGEVNRRRGLLHGARAPPRSASHADSRARQNAVGLTSFYHHINKRACRCERSCKARRCEAARHV